MNVSGNRYLQPSTDADETGANQHPNISAKRLGRIANQFFTKVFLACLRKTVQIIKAGMNVAQKTYV